MKKVLVAVAAVSVMAGATMAFADANIKGSKHDMKAVFNTVGTTTQICVYCHTPHNAISSMPLWNRNASTQGTYLLYSSPTMQSSVRQTGFTTDSMSLFCMSCHDGSPVGGSMVYNNPLKVTTESSAISGNPKANFGVNLTKTHPVNFSLKTNGNPLGGFNMAGQRRNDGTSDLIWNGTANYMGLNPNPTFPLFATVDRGSFAVECSSCHSVHDNFYAPFLRSTMTASALCLGCHRK